ncbi:hypothetical protein B0H14DRAFT_2629885 [Mycena olivaceomarginata]|nr:hypothetical protein B0H14DRAFT_2629885 [Mycena olivaceomarginata]
MPTLLMTTHPPSVSSVPAAPVKRGPGRPRKSLVPMQIQIPMPVTPAFQPLPEAPRETEIKQDVLTKGWWTVDKLSAFYEFCLGQDADAVFTKITLSSNKCWAPMRVTLIFVMLITRLAVCGQGGADDDKHPDWEEKTLVTGFLQQHAGSRHDVDGLAAAKVKMWLMNGWYDLFHSQ